MSLGTMSNLASRGTARNDGDDALRNSVGSRLDAAYGPLGA